MAGGLGNPLFGGTTSRDNPRLMPDIMEFIVSDRYLNRGQLLYPRQATLLKLIFLELDLFTSYDYDVLAEWSTGFRLPEPGEVKAPEGDGSAWFRYEASGGLARGIQPDWLTRAKMCIDEGRPWFREVVPIIGRRGSKGHIGGLAGSRVLWKYHEKVDPQNHYGIDRDKKLLAIVFAGKKEQAKANQWRDLVNVILGAPCFRGSIGNPLGESLTVRAPIDVQRERELREAGISTSMDLSTFEIVPKESTLMAGRGPTSFMQFYDEMGHVIATGANRSAEEVYQAATPSLDQFGVDGFIYEGSSPWQMTGQLYENYEQSLAVDPITRVPLRPEMLMLQLASWDLYEDWDIADSIPMVPDDHKRTFSAELSRRTPPELGQWPGDRTVRIVKAREFAPSKYRIEAEKTSPLVDEGEAKCFDPIKRAIQSYDAQMKRLERANPDTFRVERLSQWAAAMDAYLDPHQIEEMFGPWMGEPLLMKDKGVLNISYAAHGDPSKSGANFGWAVAHREGPDQNGLYHVVFDQIHAWLPSDYPDGRIDYIAIEADIIERAKRFMPTDLTFDQFNCLDGETYVPTGEGLLMVSEIAGDMAVGEVKAIDLDVESKDGPATITQVYRRGPSPIRRIKTRLGNEISVTPEHRLWVRKDKARPWHPDNDWGWLTADQIEEGDWLCLRRNPLAPGDEVDITDLHPAATGSSGHWGVTRVGDRWRAKGQVQGRQVDIGYFDTRDEAAAAADEWRQEHPTRNRITRYPKVCDENLARLLGYVISEGWVGTGFSLTNKSHEVLAEVQACLEESFGGDWAYAYDYEFQDKYERGEIRSVALAPFLRDLGCGGIAQQKSVPSVIRKSPPSVVASFLSSLFEGDGGVTIDAKAGEWVHYTTTSRKLAVEVQQLLLGLGVWSVLWEGTYRYKGEERQQWRVKISGPDLLDFEDAIGFRTKDKRAKLADATALVRGRPAAGRRSKHQRHGDFFWVRVRSITDGEADCYDLTVPGPESFIANGIVSHNSAGMIQRIQRALNAANLPKNSMVYERTATAPVNWRMAETFKTALNMGLIHAPYFELAELELRFLQLTTTQKVDHQTTGPVQTKDVADAMFNVVYHLIGEQMGAFLKGELAALAISGSQGGGLPPSTGSPNHPSDDDVFSRLGAGGGGGRPPDLSRMRRRRR